MKQNNILIVGIILIIGVVISSGCISTNNEWVEISIFCQCCQEPWETDDNIKPFFEEQGITVYDIRIESRGFVCEACSCPSYMIKEILIDNKDKEKLIDILNIYRDSWRDDFDPVDLD